MWIESMNPWPISVKLLSQSPSQLGDYELQILLVGPIPVTRFFLMLGLGRSEGDPV